MTEKEQKQVNDNIVLNDEKYKVEIANDITIPTVSSHVIDVNHPITGFTAGLITRDLVSMGEEMISYQYNHNNPTNKKK